MPVTLSSAPELITFARNPAVFKVRADTDGSGTLYDARGVRSTLAATGSDRFATNETVTILYEEPDGTSETVVFTAKAVYDDVYEIPDASFSGSDSEYWNTVISIIGAHSRIAPFFRVYNDGSILLTIQARSTDGGWGITTTTSAGFTVTDYAAEDSTLPENYRVLFEVYFERTYRGGDYRLAAQLEGVPEAGTGYVYFDISSILAAECRAGRAEPLVPAWDTAAPVLADNVRRYYVRFTERYGAPPVAQDWEYGGGIRTAMDAGISQALWAEGDFLGDMDADNALLTWLPDGKKVGLTQPEFLAWYNYTGGTSSIRLEMEWYSIEDGAMGGSDTLYATDPLSVPAGEVALIPVSPTRMGLDTEDTAYKYRVRVVISGGAVRSQWRTYYIDREYYESERYVQYLNGFGVPEVWRCTGAYGKSLKVDRDTAERPLLPGYNELASDRYQYARRWDTELAYRTGYTSRVEADALQEMLIAGEVYDVSATGYIPLMITSNSFRVTETGRDRHFYEFQARPRLEMKNYSRKAITTLGSDAWLDENGDPWWDELSVPWEIS